MTDDETRDRWRPDVYDRFRAERDRPANDLLALLDPAALRPTALHPVARPGGPAPTAPDRRVLDLGCGTGRLTRAVHDTLGATHTVGVDASPAMLAAADEYCGNGVSFVTGDIGDHVDELLRAGESVDVVFSNAALQWVAGHVDLLPHLVELLRPGGQLAFQVPANFDHPSHRLADEIGARFGLEPLHRTIGVTTPRRYAEVLWRAGLRDLDVTLRIYGMELDRTAEVVTWVSGTLLTSFERRLGDRFASFLDEYRQALLTALGDPEGNAPYFYAYPRILVRGRVPLSR